MAVRISKKLPESTLESTAIRAVQVAGFKSLVDEVRVEIAPLTVLAGTNGAGKSSAMQALLLLKQTLEASYDPGALKLDGPNVSFTSTAQVMSRVGPGAAARELVIGVESELATSRFTFDKSPAGNIDLAETSTEASDGGAIERMRGESNVERSRCFFIRVNTEESGTTKWWETITQWSARPVQRLIHVPALRGNPRRAYPLAGPSATGFPGTFDHYVAGVLHDWQRERKQEIADLGRWMAKLGLSWKVEAKRLDDTSVELGVGRLPKAKRGGARDIVNIADAGFGISQCLPVLVALLAAQHGQLVYIEQPEIHLHPHAQVALAEILAETAQRGVRVVVETHSSLLLLGVQSQVAKGLSPEIVRLHWFSRDARGATSVSTARLDVSGAFGNWPADFDDVTLKAQSDFLDAAEEHQAAS